MSLIILSLVLSFFRSFFTNVYSWAPKNESGEHPVGSRISPFKAFVQELHGALLRSLIDPRRGRNSDFLFVGSFRRSEAQKYGPSSLGVLAPFFDIG